MSLFREEVMESRRDRLHGNVNLSLPVSWQVIGLLFIVIVVATGLFLSLASYSRIETVAGIITPEGGIAEVVPTRAGIVSNLSVEAGQQVAQGESLAVVATEENLAGGGALPDEILLSLEAQEQSLYRQERQISAAGLAERAQLAARISGLRTDVAGLQERIGIQEGLVQSARNQHQLAQSVAERGFISRRELLQREEEYLGRQQQLTALRESLSRQQSAIREAQSSIRQAEAASGAQIGSIAGQRTELFQRRTSTQASRAYRLEAPIAGEVTALTARVGQAVSPQAPLMVIVPANSKLRAELYVPTSAIGFLEVGQKVALALDAFPYQRFGSLPARITALSSAPVKRTGDQGDALPLYIVTASLTTDQVSAYGEPRHLIPGMTLTARITTEEQSLLEWLFEPLFAVGRR